MSIPIVLDPDIYDTLEFSALAFGGIGRGRYRFYHVNDDGTADRTPVCIVGHCLVADIEPPRRLSERGNDAAVLQINRRLGRVLNARVSWADYCAERNIVRGERVA